jgi:hypothetical protein
MQMIRVQTLLGPLVAMIVATAAAADDAKTTTATIPAPPAAKAADPSPVDNATL